jgi:protein arginine N-methyltransferase 1
VKKKDKENNNLFAHMCHTLEYHERMLSDVARNRPFYNALKKRVTAGMTVLDIGSGTGVWAVFAAKLGAKKVVAVEKEELLIPIIENLVKENRVQDRVEVVEGDSREIKLKGKFDLIVSETIGNQGFDEHIVSIMLDARKRFLKPGGVIIPGTVSLFIAPAHFKKPYKKLPSGVPMQSNYLELLNMNMLKRINGKESLKIISKPVELARVDLMAIKTPPDLANLSARWTIKDTTAINCFVIWAESVLTEGVKIKTSDTSSWTPILYPVKPFKSKKGRLDLKLAVSDENVFWIATLSHDGASESQTYSPMFTYTTLMAHMQALKSAKRK